MASFLQSPTDRYFELSPILREVYLAISIAARPLHAKEIVEIIKRKNGSNFWSDSKTPEKTVNARISEHIRSARHQVFFRTGPNLFYHKPLNESVRFDSQYEENWHLPRLKGITDEFVLVAPRDRLQNVIHGPFTPANSYLMAELSDNLCFFMARQKAEDDTSVKQFVSYSIIRSRDQFLIYRRGAWSNPSGNLFKKWSVAFGGHISEADLTLFDEFEDCFTNNSTREVREELNLFDTNYRLEDHDFKSTLLGFINVDDNSDARQHIAAVVEIELDLPSLPRGVESEITQLQWVGLDELKAAQSNFDLWSKILIERMV